MEDQNEWDIISMDQTEFENLIEKCSTTEVNEIVQQLQKTMLAEQKTFSELTEKLRSKENGSEEAAETKEELCLSQSRLALLCSKNMKCFGKQTSGVGRVPKSEEQPVQSVPRLVELEKAPRKSLSTLHREKKEREEREKVGRLTEAPLTAVQLPKNPTLTDQTLRNAFETVLGDILGEEHKLGKPPESPTSPNSKIAEFPTSTSVRKVYISRDTATRTPEKVEDRSKLLEELRRSVPKAPVTAGDESPLVSPKSPAGSSVYYTPQKTPQHTETTKAKENQASLINSREKIMEQVRKARDESHHDHVGSKPQPKSILKNSSAEKESSQVLSEKFEERSNGAHVSEKVTESRKILPDGSELVEERMTVITQQTVVTDISSSPSPLSSLTSPSSVSSAKFQIKSPSPSHSEDEQRKSQYNYVTDASARTTSPRPYKSPFTNSGLRSESPEFDFVTVSSATGLSYPADLHSSLEMPRLPPTAPPTLLPDVMHFRAPELDEVIPFEKRDLIDGKSQHEVHLKEPPQPDIAIQTTKLRMETKVSESPKDNGNQKDEEKENFLTQAYIEDGNDQFRPLPHALNRTKVEVSENGEEKLVVEENHVCREWDPTPLLNELYKIDYNARSEVKKGRFVNMEGHLSHLPLGVKSAAVESAWKEHYFKTKEGRLHWFQRPFADEYPLGDVLLAGSEVEVNKGDCTLSIRGGRDGSYLLLRSSPQLLEKWRQSLLSHAASSVADCYIQPIYPPIPHPTEKTVIIELGSSSVRAGLLTIEPSLPQVFFPTVATVLPNGEVIVGVEALKPEVRHRGKVVKPIRPTQPAINRYTMDLDMVKHILSKVFTDLEIDSHSCKVCLSVPQNCPSPLVGDLLKLLLRDFGVKGAGVVRQPCLVLYAYDVTTGVVLDVGDRMNIVPVIDGYVVQNAIVSLPYGSSQIADSLRDKLSEKNIGLYAFVSVVEKYILRYIMEQSCRVAPDYDKEVKEYNETPNDFDKTVSLNKFHPTPEMQKEFRIDSSQWTSTEGLMKPKRWGLDISGLHKLLFNSIQASPMDSRRTLYRNIYLAGGTTLLPGLAERLENELSELVAPSIHVQVHMSPWRYHSAYIGAQVVASSIQFDQTLVTAENVDAFIRKLYASNF